MAVATELREGGRVELLLARIPIVQRIVVRLKSPLDASGVLARQADQGVGFVGATDEGHASEVILDEFDIRTERPRPILPLERRLGVLGHLDVCSRVVIGYDDQLVCYKSLADKKCRSCSPIVFLSAKSGFATVREKPPDKN